MDRPLYTRELLNVVRGLFNWMLITSSRLGKYSPYVVTRGKCYMIPDLRIILPSLVTLIVIMVFLMDAEQVCPSNLPKILVPVDVLPLVVGAVKRTDVDYGDDDYDIVWRSFVKFRENIYY
jgi:hypothetical protein